jgi:hypothetical protein
MNSEDGMRKVENGGVEDITEWEKFIEFIKLNELDRILSIK